MKLDIKPDVNVPRHFGGNIEFPPQRTQRIPKQESKVAQGAQICPVIIKKDKEMAEKPVVKQKSSTSTTISLKISGMTCAACTQNIEKVLNKCQT